MLKQRPISSQTFHVKTPRGGINVPIMQTLTFAHKINAGKIWGDNRGTSLNYTDAVWQSSGFRVGLLPKYLVDTRHTKWKEDDGGAGAVWV